MEAFSIIPKSKYQNSFFLCRFSKSTLFISLQVNILKYLYPPFFFHPSSIVISTFEQWKPFPYVEINFWKKISKLFFTEFSKIAFCPSHCKRNLLSTSILVSFSIQAPSLHISWQPLNNGIHRVEKNCPQQRSKKTCIAIYLTSTSHNFSFLAKISRYLPSPHSLSQLWRSHVSWEQSLVCLPPNKSFLPKRPQIIIFLDLALQL